MGEEGGVTLPLPSSGEGTGKRNVIFVILGQGGWGASTEGKKRGRGGRTWRLT